MQPPRPRLIALGAITFSCLSLWCSPVAAQDPTLSIVRIEEDWEMKLLTPDPASNSPQVTFFLRPSEFETDRYFQTQMNYATSEEFSGGGFHVAAVVNDSYYDEARSATRRVLSTTSDTVVWTSVMAKQGTDIVFAIKNGHSADWGDFGGVDFLISMPAESVANLNDYRPEQSLDSVDIGFGGNRVESITLKSLRVYYNQGSVKTFDVNQTYQP